MAGPWTSWEQSPWANYGAPGVPLQEPAPLQPGLGIPQGVIEAAAGPQEIEMPPMEMRPEPSIGFPTSPDELPPPPIAPPVEPEPDYSQSPVFQSAWPVDAISGPGPLPPPDAGMQPGLGMPAQALDYSQSPVAPLLAPGSELERPVDPTQEAALAYANASPYARAQQEQDFVERQRAEERKLQAEAAENDAIEAEENHQARLVAITSAKEERAKLEIDARKAAEEQVDPEKWWNDRSTGQKIAGFIAAIVGGLVQGRTGGRNSGLDMINQAIDRDIDAQKMNIAAKRGEINRRMGVNAEDFAIAKDEYYEAEKFRYASYERVKSGIASEMANYDPNGRSAIELGRLYVGVHGQQQSAAAAAEAAFQKNWIDMYKLDQEDRKIAKLKDNSGGAGGLGGMKAPKPDEIVQAPDYYTSRGLVTPPSAMSLKEYKAWQGLKEGSQKITAGETTKSREELERGIPGLVQKDGKPFVANGTPEDIVKVRKAKAAAENMVRLMDEALRVRTGWSSNIGNSEERQKLKPIWGQVKLAAKQLYDLGAITESDVPLIEGAIGTDDPSSWKDPSVAIRTARRLTLDGINTTLTGLGYDGPRWGNPEPKLSTPDESSEDKAFKALQNRDIGSITSFQSDTDNLNPADRAGAVREDAPSDIQAGIPPTKRAVIEKWAIDARSPDEAVSTKARAYLTDLTTSGGNDAVRSAARRALDEATQPLAAETPGTSAAVSFETVPPVPKKKAKK